ncbi:MAG: GNAT family protein [Candidatus Neomarinimicrobiota bacterium]
MGNSKGKRPPKVRLALLKKEHIDQLIKWRDQPEIGEHQPITRLSRDQFLNFIKSQKSNWFLDLSDREYILMIEDVIQDRPVGWMTLEVSSHQHGLARMGYSIAREYWGRGYATAAVRIVLIQLFSKTPIMRVEADCSIHNPASTKVLEKCNFRLIGTKQEYLVINGQRVDHYYYELLKKNFK